MEWLVLVLAKEFVISCGRAAVATLSCGWILGPRLGDGGAGPGQRSWSEVGEVDGKVVSI